MQLIKISFHIHHHLLSCTEVALYVRPALRHTGSVVCCLAIGTTELMAAC